MTTPPGGLPSRTAEQLADGLRNENQRKSSGDGGTAGIAAKRLLLTALSSRIPASTRGGASTPAGAAKRCTADRKAAGEVRLFYIVTIRGCGLPESLQSSAEDTVPECIAFPYAAGGPLIRSRVLV